MLVLAFDTKKKVEKATAWLGPNNKYYTSEEAYRKLKKKKIDAKYYKNKKRRLKMEKKQKEEEQKIQQRKEKELQKKQRTAKKKLNEAESQAYKKCVNLMFDWMGYSENAKMPRLFFGQMGQWHNSYNYSYEVVLETMLYVQDSISKALDTKEFKDDSSKVKYICVAIGDHLNDGLRSFAEKQKAIQAAREEAERIPYDIPTEEELMNLGNREEQPKEDHTEMREIMKRIMGDLW